MKKLLAILLAMVMVFTLTACNNANNTENDDEKIAQDITENTKKDAEEFDSFSVEAVEHYLKAYDISYKELQPDWEYTVGDKGAYADNPDGSGHAVVIFKKPDGELTDEQINAYYEQVFRVTAAASDDGYNIIGHEFVGDGENPAAETTLEKALDGFLQGWCFRKNGKNMAVYVSSTYDREKDSEFNRPLYYNGVKFDIGVGLQKSFDETLSDAEKMLEDHEDEIKAALGG